MSSREKEYMAMSYCTNGLNQSKSELTFKKSLFSYK